MAITDDIERALRLRGEQAIRVFPTASLGDVAAILAAHGLTLAVVSEGLPTIQLTSAQLVMAAVDRALAAGEPEHGLSARISRMCGLKSAAQITRVLDDGRELGPEARAALEEHLLDPKARPLPPVLKDGRPGLKAIAAAGNGWDARREKRTAEK